METEVVTLVAKDEKKRFPGRFPGPREKASNFTKPKKEDHLPDVVAVKNESLARHTFHDQKLQLSKIKTKLHQMKFGARKAQMEDSVEKSARAEILNMEDDGFLDAEDHFSYEIAQSEIVANVDVASVAKSFQLRLPEFGPYRTNYSSNGRFLLLGGRKGHVAALDWQTKRLVFETNVMEMVRDVQYLHTENMLAVAQKNYTYIYDSMGTELHCLKALHAAQRLEFLPRHFLLVASTRKSWLHWMDVSVGKMVRSTVTRAGDLSVMCQNPANAIIHCGHANGTVSLWSPNSEEPLARLLAHHASLRGIAVDHTGNYMYTSSLDRKLRVWDLRTYRPLHAYTLPFGLGELAVSQKGCVAAEIGNTVQVFRGMEKGETREPYIVDRFPGIVSSLDFVPFEDVLGVGHAEGFASILVPGSGEANVDALRANPYETKKQRREREVKQLLDKINPALIALDPSDINRVNTSILEEEQEKRKEILWLKPSKIEFTPRHKMKGRGGGVNKAKTTEVVQAAARLKNNLKRAKIEKEVFGTEEKVENKSFGVLDRFKKRKV